MHIQQVTVGSMAVCCYIISCEQTNEAAVIDPGGNEEEIIDICKNNSLFVKYIIDTHGHPDHVCGNGRIKEVTGAEIVMHKEDALFFWKPEIKEYFSMLGLTESPPPDILVEDGSVIEFGKEKLEVIHTPGHTPGGICLYNKPNCFTGDTLFVGGVGRTDFPGGSTQELLDSIKNRLLKLPPDTTIWPGHGYGGSRSTIQDEERSNPFLNSTGLF